MLKWWMEIKQNWNQNRYNSSVTQLWSLSTFKADSLCTCLTQCYSLTTGNHCSAPWHTVPTGTFPLLSNVRGFVLSSKDANLKFKFCRHVSLHAIKDLLKNIPCEITHDTTITHYSNNVYLISLDTSFRRSE